MATESLSEEELDKIAGAQMGLTGAGIDAQMQYILSHGGKTPEGCFDFDQKLYDYGKNITFNDLEFKCFKVQDGEMNVGVFHSVKLVKYLHSHCQKNQIHQACTDMDARLMKQLFEQLYDEN